MKRREFIAKSAATAAGAVAAPYLLPSGRLFAQSGIRSAQHVVLVLFAGGVRHQESAGMRYLDDAQTGAPYAGNIMNNMLTGAAPDQMIVYGTGSGGNTPIPTILSQSLQQQGTLFSEVRAISAGHYGGLNSILQGADVSSQGLKMRPVSPTIFEYLRRHGGYSATDVWFVGNSINGSLPLLNYSGHPDYGMKYGANFFAPFTTFFSQEGREQFGNMKVYHPEMELNPMYRLKAFLDNNFSQNEGYLNSLGNTEEEKQNIKAFMNSMYEKTNAGTVVHPPVIDNADTLCVSYAAELLSWFKPSFTCVNLSAVDECHSNFTGYLQSLHRADHAVGWLWDYIQTQIPEMANNTVIIAIPECGRNDEPNAVADANGWLAYDHSDANAFRIFSMMAGPGIPQNLVVGSENNPIGSVTDAMLTVADLLGVKADVTNAGMLYPDTLSFLDRI